MDLTMIDVGQVAGVQVNDEVVILGNQGKEEITADAVARLLNTINYEVVSSITSRVEKLYVS
jgi:alanine racemase